MLTLSLWVKAIANNFFKVINIKNKTEKIKIIEIKMQDDSNKVHTHTFFSGTLKHLKN